MPCSGVTEMRSSLLEKGVIEPAKSGYAANSRIIRKKNGQGRLVINYIPLNAISHRDSYALPHVMDILGAVQGKQFFSSMDCTQGFYQIEVDSRDRHKTGFSTPFGNYQFKRCPFGARNSCAEFQAAMNRILHDGLFTRCVVYVDDILVFGETKEEHNINLRWVLEQCQQNNVKLKLEKCKFLQQEVEYLGFLISGSSIKPLPDKIKRLSALKPPKNKTDLRSIIGKLNFYSRFIPNYSKSLESLRNLMLKDKDFQWRAHHQVAYEQMLAKLDSIDTQLLIPRHEHKKILLIVLHDSIEALIVNKDNHLINRTSRLLSTSESNYSFIEKQLLALVMALNKFTLFIEPTRFTIKAPNKDLDKIIKQVHRPERVDNLLLKIPSGLDEFTIEVDESLPTNSTNKQAFHLPEEIFYIDGACRNNGKPNCQASWALCAEYDKQLELTGFVLDSPSNQSAELQAAIEACKLAKSRGLKMITIITDSKYLYSAATLWIDKWKSNNWTDHKHKPVVNTKQFEQLLEAKQGLDIEWCHVKGHSNNVGNNRADALARSLLDPKAATLCAMINHQVNIQDEDPEIAQLKRDIKNGHHTDLNLLDDKIYFVDTKLPDGQQHRVYVPKRARHYILQLAHDDATYGGHLGIRKTFKKLSRFYWPRMHADIESYVKSCDTCQKFKSPPGLPAGYLHSIPVSQVFEHIHLDIVGPLTTTFNGNRYVITATDAMSKWAFARPSQSVRTKELIHFVEEEILAVHGMPKRIITDRGTQFTSAEWQEFITKLKIEHKLTSPYHPQANGIDERLNGTLMRILRSYVDAHQEKWDEHLKWSLYLYNTTVHESIGYSPYHVLFGMDSRSPLKPPDPLNNSDELSLKEVRTRIRNDIVGQNKAAQDHQKLYYDKHRGKCKLFVGQLVYIRVNAPPTHLSKKFFYKWDGPVVITGFVGDEDDPKAVAIFDYDNLQKKVVALTNVKPMINTYKNEDNKSKGGGHTLIDSSDSQANNELFYHTTLDDLNITQVSIDRTIQSPPNNNQQRLSSNTSSTQDTLIVESPDADELNIQSRTLRGPISSSPRRVTISDTVETRTYQPHDGTYAEDTENNSESSSSTEQIDQPVHLVDANRDSPQAPPTLTERAVYNSDDIRKDPTYIPPTGHNNRDIDTRRISTDSNRSDTSTRSLIPRYNLRPRPER